MLLAFDNVWSNTFEVSVSAMKIRIVLVKILTNVLQNLILNKTLVADSDSLYQSSDAAEFLQTVGQKVLTC